MRTLIGVAILVCLSACHPYDVPNFLIGQSLSAVDLNRPQIRRLPDEEYAPAPGYQP